MNSVSPYLSFTGNCREAMAFYQKCLGGKLVFQTLGDSPLSANMPGRMKKYILHATLSCGSLVLNGSDMVEERNLFKGNAVSLLLNCTSENEIRLYYKKLSSNGKAINPLAETYWGALFGGLVDRYGNYWLLNYDRNSNLSK